MGAAIENPSASTITRAAEILRAGGLVSLPTETVYGLGADATNDRAVAKIYEAKARPQFNPLILHVTGGKLVATLVEISPPARRLMDAFWPGPLTLVLPRRADSVVSGLATAGLDTVAVRLPDHPVMQAVIEALGRPVAAPSANRSGHLSPTDASHVMAGLGDGVPLVIDGGPCRIGIESTIAKVEAKEVIMLRPGAIGAGAIANVAGLPVRSVDLTHADARPVAPGMLLAHYAPRHPLAINQSAPRENRAFLAFGPVPSGQRHALTLSADQNLQEAAANLFGHLHQLDDMCTQERLAGIDVAPISVLTGEHKPALALAIEDRLNRAATPG